MTPNKPFSIVIVLVALIVGLGLILGNDIGCEEAPIGFTPIPPYEGDLFWFDCVTPIEQLRKLLGLPY